MFSVSLHRKPAFRACVRQYGKRFSCTRKKNFSRRRIFRHSLTLRRLLKLENDVRGYGPLDPIHLESVSPLEAISRLQGRSQGATI